MATWTALKARQEAAMAPAEALAKRLEAAGIPISKITVDGVVTAGGAMGAGGDMTGMRALAGPALDVNNAVGSAAINADYDDAAKAQAEYAAGIKKIKDVMKRAGGSMKGMTS